MAFAPSKEQLGIYVRTSKSGTISVTFWNSNPKIMVRPLFQKKNDIINAVIFSCQNKEIRCYTLVSVVDFFFTKSILPK